MRNSVAGAPVVTSIERSSEEGKIAAVKVTIDGKEVVIALSEDEVKDVAGQLMMHDVENYDIEHPEYVHMLYTLSPSDILNFKDIAEAEGEESLPFDNPAEFIDGLYDCMDSAFDYYKDASS